MSKTKPEERQPMYIVVPTPMMEWMQAYHAELKCKESLVLVSSVLLNPEPLYYYQSQFDFKDDYKGMKAETTLPLSETDVSERSADEMQKIIDEFNPENVHVQNLWKLVNETMNLKKIIAVEVDHCPQSYGCLLVQANGDKIIYSGDTLPCTNFRNYALNAKVMIHEATLDSSLEADAKMKKHTTTGQAL